MKQAERIFVGLGSNLDDPEDQIENALLSLSTLPCVDLIETSSLYRTSPWGEPDQPTFVNAVAEIRCRWQPVELLDRLQQLECAAGRVRDRRWGPRTLDLDLLAWGRRTMASPRLELPHPRLANRRFVLVPWAEISPNFEVVGLGTVEQLLTACADTGEVTRLREPACTPTRTTTTSL